MRNRPGDYCIICPIFSATACGKLQRLTDDVIDFFPAGAIDHQVPFLASREEIRIIEHRLERGSQRREPLRRHARAS